MAVASGETVGCGRGMDGGVGIQCGVRCGSNVVMGRGVRMAGGVITGEGHPRGPIVNVGHGVHIGCGPSPGVGDGRDVSAGCGSSIFICSAMSGCPAMASAIPLTCRPTSGVPLICVLGVTNMVCPSIDHNPSRRGGKCSMVPWKGTWLEANHNVGVRVAPMVGVGVSLGIG